MNQQTLPNEPTPDGLQWEGGTARPSEAAAGGAQALRPRNIGDRLRSQSRWLLLAQAAVLLSLVAYADYLMAWEVSLFVFYALPILLTVWYGDRSSGIIVAALSMIAWWWANRYDNPYENNASYLWAAGSRFVYFAFVAIGGTALKNQREADLSRIDALEHARALERDLVNVSEYEQRRIGQDLHDGLCQVLAGIGCAVTMLKDELQAKSLPEATTAEEIEGYVRDAATEARDLARGIFPVLKDAIGLETALEELTVFASKLHHRKVTFDIGEGIEIGNPEAAMHLYRIAQGALSNALKHGKPKNVTISLHKLNGQLYMRIEDDGCGIPDPLPPSAGMGLRTMRYRSKLIGAQLKIERRTPTGTLIHCWIDEEKVSHPPRQA